jgi:hypothetical protein
MTPDEYLEGYYSLVSGGGQPRFTQHPANHELLAPVADAWAVQRLGWFTRGFIAATHEDGKLVLTDLRMGSEPNYVFRYVVAEGKRDRLHPVPPRRFDYPDFRARATGLAVAQNVGRDRRRRPVGCALNCAKPDPSPITNDRGLDPAALGHSMADVAVRFRKESPCVARHAEWPSMPTSVMPSWSSARPATRRSCSMSKPPASRARWQS